MSGRPQRYEPPCAPPVWARGGHAQTLWGHLLPCPAPAIDERGGYARRVLALPDGDRLLAFAREGTSGVRVHLFHGLSGDVGSDYMRLVAATLCERGHSIWAVNHRGCGAGRGLAARPYHSGRSEDLEAVLAASRADAPELVHLVVGFSLSGNLALLHAGQGLPTQADGIVAVNPPVDLERASVQIGHGLSRLYELRFMARLRREVRLRHADGLLARRYDIPRLGTLVGFDDLFTAPECGFADGRDYYRRCSSLPLVPRVRVPGVILTAADDPFVDPRAYEEVALPPQLLLHVEPTGGHVGYLAREGAGWRRWLPGAVAHYVEELERLSRARARAAGATGSCG